MNTKLTKGERRFAAYAREVGWREAASKFVYRLDLENRAYLPPPCVLFGMSVRKQDVSRARREGEPTYCQRRFYVNAYRVVEVYGGPEEGGWWYNLRCPLESVRLRHKRSARKVAERLWHKHKEIIEGDIYSSLGGAELDISIESGPPERPRRQHYE